MKRWIAGVVLPIAATICIPLLLLIAPTERMLRLVWIAAMLGLSTHVGLDVAKHMSRRQAIALVVMGAAGAAAVGLTRGFHFADPRLEYALAGSAVIVVFLMVPVQVLIAKAREERENRSE